MPLPENNPEEGGKKMPCINQRWWETQFNTKFLLNRKSGKKKRVCMSFRAGRAYYHSHFIEKVITIHRCSRISFTLFVCFIVWRHSEECLRWTLTVVAIVEVLHHKQINGKKEIHSDLRGLKCGFSQGITHKCSRAFHMS